MSHSSPRILIIRRRYLGDIVLLGSLTRNIKNAWPQAHITVLTEEAYANILKLNPDVDAAWSLPKKDAGALAKCKFFYTLYAERFTHTLNIDNNERTALLTRISRAPIRATIALEGTPIKWAKAYTHIAHISSKDYASQHITDTYLRILEPLGIPVSTHDVKLRPRAEDSQAAQTLLHTLKLGKDRPRIVIHPGSRSSFRQWPSERFATVADHFQSSGKAYIALIAGPGESHIVQEIAQHMQTPAAVIDTPLPIPHFAAVLSEFDLMLCHDSGPMHIATTVGVPVVALYGSQQCDIWHPVGDSNHILQAPLPEDLSTVKGEGDMTDSYKNTWVRRIHTDDVIPVLEQKLDKLLPSA